MNRSRVVLWISALGFGLALSANAQQGPINPPDQEQPQGVDVLTQGPVHEAFANPVVYDPAPGPVIPRTPPEPIEELPPDQRPDGADIVWIPGYWAWDDERNDFLWISGLWRALPPGRQWVPGYWNQTEGGFRWVPGVWTPVADAEQEVSYLPMPPATLEAGPNIVAPGPDFFWTPGTWMWRETRYSWRPGFWAPIQENWVWTPAHYVWTPAGYLFVDGYWDRTIVQRGVLFAPVALAPAVYTQPRFVYTPTISIVASALMTSLFVRPSYHRYCFGDYYAASYAQSGIYPWYSFNQRRMGFDPLYSYYSAVNVRRNPAWNHQIRDVYHYRRDHIAARPPRTYVQQRTFVQNNVTNITNINNVTNITKTSNVVLARPIAQVAASRESTFRYEPVGRGRREEIQRQAAQLRQVRERRQHQEVRVSRLPRTEQPRPHRVEHYRSPIAARPLSDRALKATGATLSSQHTPFGPGQRPTRPGSDRPRPEVARPNQAATAQGLPGPRIPQRSDGPRSEAPRSHAQAVRPNRPAPQPTPDQNQQQQRRQQLQQQLQQRLQQQQEHQRAGIPGAGRPEARREALRPRSDQNQQQQLQQQLQQQQERQLQQRLQQQQERQRGGIPGLGRPEARREVPRPNPPASGQPLPGMQNPQHQRQQQFQQQQLQRQLQLQQRRERERTAVPNSGQASPGQAGGPFGGGSVQVGLQRHQAARPGLGAAGRPDAPGRPNFAPQSGRPGFNQQVRPDQRSQQARPRLNREPTKDAGDQRPGRHRPRPT